MLKFTNILEEYLNIREQLNGDYYDNKSIASRTEAIYYMRELANELDDIIEKVTNE